MHISFEDYVNGYGGGFPFPDEDPGFTTERALLFSRYNRMAVAELERYKRIYTVTVPESSMSGDECGCMGPEEYAVCAMTEALMYFDAAKEMASNPVSSASIGSVSVSYGGASFDKMDLSPAGQAKALFRCASRYLDIYRGVG